jgi:DNA-binding Xre family transcriptional regulator
MYKDSDLEKWLRSKNMSSTDLAKIIGCSRTVIWKIKTGQTVCPKTATKIIELTHKQVVPQMESVGGRR